MTGLVVEMSSAIAALDINQSPGKAAMQKNLQQPNSRIEREDCEN
jgi:hypothetical protein